MTALLVALTAALPIGRDVDLTARWERHGVLLGGFRNLYNLHLVREPEGAATRFTGFFFGWAVEPCNPGYPGCDAIYLARGDDLRRGWQVYAGGEAWDDGRDAGRWVPVVCAQDEPYDQWHNGDPTVVKVGDTYHLAYSATGHNLDGIPYGQAGDRDGSILCVMGATSRDGITWTRSAEPILIHREDLGAPGLAHGESHLLGSYHRPTLLHEEGVFRLWFDYWAGDARGVSVGYAECRGEFLDPDDWEVLRAGDEPVLAQFPNPDVVRVGDLLLAFGDPPVGHTGHGWIDRKITLAASRDGLAWEVLGHLEPDPGVPATHVPEAYVEPEGDGYRVWLTYATQRGGEPYDYMYDSLRLMSRVYTRADLEAIAEVLSPG